MNKQLLNNAGELSANPLITKKVSNFRLIDEHYADSAGWVLTGQSAPKIEIENSLTFLNCSDI